MSKVKPKNYWTRDDDKLLHAVERNNYPKVCELLAKKNLQCYKLHPEKGVSALHVAVREGYSGIVDKFTEQKPFLGINAKDNLGQTAVHHAAKKARYSVLLKLLQCKPDLSLVDGNNKGVLHHASEGGHINCVQLLISSGAPTDLKDKDGKTALAYAAEKGQASICRLLIENGSCVNELDHANRTPLVHASMHRHASVCDYLVRKGAKVDVLDLKGHNAMWHATWNMDKETARVLAQAVHDSTDSDLSPTRNYSEREIAEDHYEDMGTVKATKLSNLDSNSCHLLPIFENDLKTPTLNQKSSSLMHLDHLSSSTPAKQSEKEEAATLSGKLLSASTEHQGSDKMGESSTEGHLNMASFRALLDNTFPKKPSLEKLDDSKENEKDEKDSPSPKKPVRSSTTEYVTSAPQPDSNDQELHESTSNHSFASSKTSETLPQHQQSLHQQQKPHHQQQHQQQDRDTYNFFLDTTPPSSKHIQSYESLDEQQQVCSKKASPHKEGEDVVDANNNRVTNASCDEKNYILKEKLDLLEKLKLASESRQALEDEKKELLKELEVASVSQQWTVHELRCMKTSVERMLLQLKEAGKVKVVEKVAAEEGDKSREFDRKSFAEDLESIQSRINELLQLHGGELGEEEQGVMSQAEADESAEYRDYLNRKIITLVKEKNLLAYKLKQILEENSEMKSQLKEVEVVIENAVELKKENEILIKDYEQFKKIKDEEMTEVDELVRLFKESLTENETLRSENEKLAQKLQERKEKNDVVDVEYLKKENLRLMFEKVQLEETVIQQKQTLLHLDERLEASKKEEKAQDETDSALIAVETSAEVVQKRAENKSGYKDLYENLQKELLQKDQELEENKELVVRIKKAMSGYEAVKEEIEALKLKLEQKNAEIKSLNSKVLDMSKQLKDSFDNYKMALESVEKRNDERLSAMRVENERLMSDLNLLKEDLTKKETSFQLLNSNLNLERRNKQNLEEFKSKVLELADESRDDSKALEKLRKIVEESLKMKNENFKIKNELYEIELKNEVEKGKNKELRGLNESLQIEIASLKRTIGEQGAYLAILSPRHDAVSEDRVDSPFIKAKTEAEVQSSSHHTPVFGSPLAKDVFEANKTIKKQKLEIEKLNNEILILSSQIECLEQNEKDLQNRSQASSQRREDEIEDLEIQVSQLNMKCSDLEEKNSEMKRVLEGQSKRLNSVEDIESYFERVFKTYYRLSGDQRKPSFECKQKIDHMTEWLETQNLNNKQLSQHNELLKQEVHKLRTKIADLETQREKIVGEVACKSGSRASSIEPCFSQLKREYGELKEIEKEIKALKEREDHLKNELVEMMDSLVDDEKKLSALKKNPACEVDELLKADSDFKRSKAEKDKITNQLDYVFGDIDSVEKSLKKKKKIVKQLVEDTRNELKSSIEAFEDLSKELEEDNEDLIVNGGLESEWLSPKVQKKDFKPITEVFSQTLPVTTDAETHDKTELEEARKEFQRLVEKYHESIDHLEKMCADLKNENDDLRQKYSNILETNEILSEKYNRSEDLLNELERKEQTICELKGAVEESKKKLQEVVEEKESLSLQKEKSDVLLRIEKLKNLSDSKTESFETAVEKDVVDSCRYEERHVEVHNGTNGTSSPESKKYFSETQTAFNNLTPSILSLKASIRPLRVENRRTFLNIVGIQSCLRRKLSLDRSSACCGTLPLNGHDHFEHNNNLKGFENNPTEDFLHALSNKCFENFSSMVELEERADSLFNDSPVDSSEEAVIDLLNRCTAHKDILQRLQSLMQAVLENQLDVRRALELLPQLSKGCNGVTLRSDCTFKGTSPAHKKTVQNKIRVIRSSGSESEDRACHSNDVSPQKLRALQNQLAENERRYREVISSYRRHLLSAVQGDMDPGIKKALLNIVEPHNPHPM